MNQFLLPNKLRCLLIPNKNKNIKLFTIEICVKVGSRDEDDITRGISHLLEHMLFKGTIKRKSYKEIKGDFDKYGGSYNATTSNNLTCYFVTAPTKYINHYLNLISDIVFNSKIKQKDVNKEKQVVIEELNIMLDRPVMSVLTAMQSCLKGHPLEHLVIGTEKHILNFNAKIINKYYKQFYIPSNMVLSISGNYPKNIKNLIKKYFNVKSNSNFLNPIPKLPLKLQNKPRITIIKKLKEQPTISIVFPLTFNLYDIKKSLMLKLICIAFGSNPSSRLYTEIREKAAIAYNMTCGLESFQDLSLFSIEVHFEKNSLFKNNNLNKKRGVLEILLRELKKLLKGLKKQELVDAKNYLKSKLCLSRESNHYINSFYGYQVVFQHKKILNFDQYDKIIDSIQLKNINKLIKEAVNIKKLNLNVLGNFSEKTLKLNTNKLIKKIF